VTTKWDQIAINERFVREANAAERRLRQLKPKMKGISTYEAEYYEKLAESQVYGDLVNDICAAFKKKHST
jgi:hypothetical protein